MADLRVESSLAKLILIISFCFLKLASAEDPARSAREYRRILIAAPIGLYPANLEDVHSIQIMLQVAEGLAKFDNDQIQPALAQRWEISDSQKEYTFILRPDAYFSNGKPVTSDDVIQCFKQLLTKTSVARQELMIVKGVANFLSGKNKVIAGLQAISPSVIKIHTLRPYPQLLSILASPNFVILPPKSLDLLQKGVVPFVGSGPYELKEVTQGKSLVLTKQKYYYDKNNVFYERVRYDVVPNANTAITGFFDGTYDDIWPHQPESIPERYVSEIERIPSLTAFSWYLQFNLKRPPLTHLKLRDWIGETVDIDGFLKEQKLPPSFRALGYIPKGLMGYRGDVMTSSNQNKKSLLDVDSTLSEAGCHNSAPCRIEVIYAHDVDNALRTLIKPFEKYRSRIRFQLKKLGRSEWYRRFTHQKYSMIFIGNNADHYETFYLLRYLLDSRYHPGFDQHKIRDLLTRATETQDKLERSTIYSRIDEEVLRQRAVVPIYHGDVPFRYVHNRVEGYSISVLGYPYLLIRHLRARGPKGTTFTR